MKKIAIVLTNGVEEIEAVGTIDLLRRADNIVDIYSTSKQEVVGSHGIGIKHDKIIDQLIIDEYDALVIPGGPGVANLLTNNQLLEIVKNFDKQEKLICAICAAPQILGKSEILKKGTNITHFPGSNQFLDNVSDKTPKPVVIDNNIITSVSAGAVFDFALAIIQSLNGIEMAETIKKQIIYDL